MLTKLVEMYKLAKATHASLYSSSVHLFTETAGDRCSLADQVDAVYTLRKAEDLLDDVRKELKKVRARIEVRTCLAFDIEQITKLSTPFCTGTSKVSQFAKYPAKRENDPEKFDALMKSMGVPEDLLTSEVGKEVVRPNWEGFASWFTERQANGQPLPDGITVDDVYTVMELATRKKKDPDEE